MKVKNKCNIIFGGVIFILFHFGIDAQEKISVDTLNLVSYSFYKKHLVNTDSLGYRIYKNDTLIRLSRRPDNSNLKGAVSVPYEFKDNSFLKYYKTIAFRIKDGTGSDSDSHNMKYWKDNIKLYFANNVDYEVKKELIRFAKLLSKNVDSLHIEYVKNIDKANYVVYTNEDFNFENNLNNNKEAEYYLYWKNNSLIHKAYLRYNKNRLFGEDVIKLKLKELFIASLGWFKLSDDLSCNNFFANCFSDDKHMTPLDWELLKYHYSYGICKGTKLVEFEDQHRRAKKALKDLNIHLNFLHVID